MLPLWTNLLIMLSNVRKYCCTALASWLDSKLSKVSQQRTRHHFTLCSCDICVIYLLSLKMIHKIYIRKAVYFLLIPRSLLWDCVSMADTSVHVRCQCRCLITTILSIFNTQDSPMLTTLDWPVGLVMNLTQRDVTEDYCCGIFEYETLISNALHQLR